MEEQKSLLQGSPRLVVAGSYFAEQTSNESFDLVNVSHYGVQTTPLEELHRAATAGGKKRPGGARRAGTSKRTVLPALAGLGPLLGEDQCSRLQSSERARKFRETRCEHIRLNSARLCYGRPTIRAGANPTPLPTNLEIIHDLTNCDGGRNSDLPAVKPSPRVLPAVQRCPGTGSRRHKNHNDLFREALVGTEPDRPSTSGVLAQTLRQLSSRGGGRKPCAAGQTAGDLPGARRLMVAAQLPLKIVQRGIDVLPEDAVQAFFSAESACRNASASAQMKRPLRSEEELQDERASSRGSSHGDGLERTMLTETDQHGWGLVRRRSLLQAGDPPLTSPPSQQKFTAKKPAELDSLQVNHQAPKDPDHDQWGSPGPPGAEGRAGLDGRGDSDEAPGASFGNTGGKAPQGVEKENGSPPKGCTSWNGVLDAVMPKQKISPVRREGCLLLRHIIFGKDWDKRLLARDKEKVFFESCGTMEEVAQLLVLWRRLDEDNSGRVDIMEFRGFAERCVLAAQGGQDNNDSVSYNMDREGKNFCSMVERAGRLDSIVPDKDDAKQFSSPRRGSAIGGAIPAQGRSDATSTSGGRGAEENTKGWGKILERLAQMLLGKKSSFIIEDMMRIVWPCASIEELRRMKRWCEDMQAHSTVARVRTPTLLPDSELEALSSVFRFFDKDQSGGVTFDEMIKSGLVDDDQATRYIQEWDADKSGELGLMEFCEMMCPCGFRAHDGAKHAMTKDGRVVIQDETHGYWRLNETDADKEEREREARGETHGGAPSYGNARSRCQTDLSERENRLGTSPSRGVQR